MSSWLGKFHDFTKKYDPLGHEIANGVWNSSTKLVNESSRAMQSTGDKWGWNTKVPEYGKNLSEKDKGSFNRWGENTIGGIGAVLGGMYAYGAAGAGGSGGAGGAGAGAGYTEAGGAVVSDAAGGGFTWTGSGGGLGSTGAGGSGSTGLLGQGGSSSGMSMLQRQMASKALTGGNQQQQQQQPQVGGFSNNDRARPGGEWIGGQGR